MSTMFPSMEMQSPYPEYIYPSSPYLEILREDRLVASRLRRQQRDARMRHAEERSYQRRLQHQNRKLQAVRLRMMAEKTQPCTAAVVSEEEPEVDVQDQVPRKKSDRGKYDKSHDQTFFSDDDGGGEEEDPIVCVRPSCLNLFPCRFGSTDHPRLSQSDKSART